MALKLLGSSSGGSTATATTAAATTTTTGSATTHAAGKQQLKRTSRQRATTTTESSKSNNNKKSNININNATIIPLVVIGSLVIHLVLFFLESTSTTTTSVQSINIISSSQPSEDSSPPPQQQRTATQIINNEEDKTFISTTTTTTRIREQQHTQQSQQPNVVRPPTLEEVVSVSGVTSCRPEDMSNNPKTTIDDFRFIQSTILNNDKNKTHYFNVNVNVVGGRRRRRKIPKIIHVTSKSKCMHKHLADNLDKWRHFHNYEFYIHDDEAVEYLLTHPYFVSIFPMLSKIQPCVLSGAMKSDLWRLLVLWQYGGLYTDIDNAPGKRFYKQQRRRRRQQYVQHGGDGNGGGGGGDDDNNNNTTDSHSYYYYNDTVIDDDVDAWFVVERIGAPSQYFMASSPKHPLLYVALMVTMKNILTIPSLQATYVAQVSGPTALKEASIIFLGRHQHMIKDMDLNGRGGNLNRKIWMGSAGTYVGIQNRTVTVVGSQLTTNDYIHRESIHPFDKRDAYVAMGMKHFTWAHRGKKSLRGWPGGRIKPLDAEQWNISCLEHLYKTYHHDDKGTATATTTAQEGLFFNETDVVSK